MNRAEHQRRGRSVAQQLAKEKLRDLVSVSRIRKPPLDGKRVTLEPLEKLFAVRGYDVGLRIVDMRVDEARNDQFASVVDDRRGGG